MARLGSNQYGKAETHLVRVVRDGAAHELRDLLVSVALSGELEAVHLDGDNSAVLATDTQKNTVYAFAKEHGVGTPEQFGALLARHFLGGAITRARVEVREVGWTRLSDHAFAQGSREERIAVVVADESQWFASGLSGLVVLKTTDSEFHGFPRDRYTTLAETRDRVLATEVSARWRHDGTASFEDARRALLECFAAHHSLSLQQTLYAMGSAVLEACPAVQEIRLSMPNKHHFVVDLTPFGLSNENEVFHADDRPYGLIEGAVVRDGAPDAGPLWDPYPLV
ncbi:urate oxidase [Solirubrobacter sp. CPCC 204708]|uniref:Uricase n=1 Tax=Solirubrobacter deserti TaxID=2282478 RepID=A0ABT4RU17_9ACTN|nr:urate oxidase [Solirubrobacter deserti]MBE2316251.1 urate oxidase [Solirubrobacter deserti]MDA0142069.1 urate oxidase [Solirubrobacter deserti]